MRAYTDFQRAQLAIQNKDTAEASRIARSGELTSMQKVWTFTSAARLLGNSERSRAVELLEDALAESRRIGGSDPDRARALTAVAAGMVEVDPVRAIQMAKSFTGEAPRAVATLAIARSCLRRAKTHWLQSQTELESS